MKRYLNGPQICDVLGIAHATFKGWRFTRPGRWLDPDAYIGDLPGWDPVRVERFKAEYAALPPAKRSFGKGQRAWWPERPGWWDVPEPERFMSQAEIARLFDIQPKAVLFMRTRTHTFIEADAAIGEPEREQAMHGNVYGWKRERVIRFGIQDGRLPEDYDRGTEDGGGTGLPETAGNDPPLARAG
ncbi:MAG: hypothetical protein J2P26_04270 [Nocardiopsaceae bacterium]|nr:hypothetical protein [Nocardiopsaceae bacterium]